LTSRLSAGTYKNKSAFILSFPRASFISLVPVFPQTINLLGANGNGFNPGGRGPSDVIAFPNIYQLFGPEADVMVHKIQSNLQAWAASQAGSAISAAALLEIYQIQADLIINKNGELEPDVREVRWSLIDIPSTCCRVVSK